MKCSRCLIKVATGGIWKRNVFFMSCDDCKEVIYAESIKEIKEEEEPQIA